MYVNVREKMKEWGVEAEKGEGIKEEEKQRQYDIETHEGLKKSFRIYLKKRFVTL